MRVMDVKVCGKVYRGPVHNLMALPVSVHHAQEFEIPDVANVDLYRSLQEFEL